MTKMEKGKKSPTPGIVGLATHLSCTINKSPKKRVTKILNYQLLPMKALGKTETLLDSVIIIKKQNTEKGVVLSIFSPLISLYKLS